MGHIDQSQEALLNNYNGFIAKKQNNEKQKRKIMKERVKSQSDEFIDHFPMVSLVIYILCFYFLLFCLEKNGQKITKPVFFFFSENVRFS